MWCFIPAAVTNMSCNRWSFITSRKAGVQMQNKNIEAARMRAVYIIGLCRGDATLLSVLTLGYVATPTFSLLWRSKYCWETFTGKVSYTILLAGRRHRWKQQKYARARQHTVRLFPLPLNLKENKIRFSSKKLICINVIFIFPFSF